MVTGLNAFPLTPVTGHGLPTDDHPTIAHVIRRLALH